MTLSISPDLIALSALVALAIGVCMTLFYLVCAAWRRALGCGAGSAVAAWVLANFWGAHLSW